MKFLETITFMENDVLVPIQNIEYIMMRAKSSGSYEIIIKGRAELGWEEHFSNEKDARKRYEMIKEIVEGK